MEPHRKVAAVVGVGKMGTAICYAMKKLGFYVLGLDTSESAADSFRKHIDGNDGAFYALDPDSGASGKNWDDILIHEKPDVVISSLPYHQTEDLADWCINNGFRYCDLGGRVDVSQRINCYAKTRGTKPIFTDLGLAPGWVNILAEQGCKEIHKTPENIKMMVGGLPGIPLNPPLNYAVTWSIDGLINEYKDDCEVLIDGELKREPGMLGREEVYFKLINENLEAFYTSGGASHTIKSMQAKGVKNCSYKTLRYKGHCDTINFLIRKCNLSDECLLEIFKKGCCDSDAGDVVLIKVHIKSGDISWDKEIVVPPTTTFSAMQRATAFPISAVASLMAEGRLEGDKGQRRDYWVKHPMALSYQDIPFAEFNNRLDQIFKIS